MPQSKPLSGNPVNKLHISESAFDSALLAEVSKMVYPPRPSNYGVTIREVMDATGCGVGMARERMKQKVTAGIYKKETMMFMGYRVQVYSRVNGKR